MSSAGPSEVHVLSPYFDGPNAVRGTVDAIVALMAVHGDRRLVFQGPGRHQPSGTIELDLPAELRAPWHRRLAHTFRAIPDRDEQGELRQLHAKSLWLERGDRAVFVIGSSNFTSPGLGTSTVGPVNVELNLAYVLPNIADAFARACRTVGPHAEDVDLERGQVDFLGAPTQTPEPEGWSPLPDAFGTAVFRPDGARGILHLEIAVGAPGGFTVQADDVGVLLAEPDWTARCCPSVSEVDWRGARPPSSLIVQWTLARGEQRQAIWVVNVSDTAKLPAPEELRDLTLDQLLAVLTSARPLHEAVAQALRAPAATDASPDGRIDDVLKRHQSNAYLLRRMRRVAAALEGLRRRLERPAWNLDALRWRLHGPVGPAALARQLAAAEGRGAAFMLAEVARTVRQTDWSEVARRLGAESVAAEVAAVIRELAAMVEEVCGDTPPALDAYVRETFAEITR